MGTPIAKDAAKATYAIEFGVGQEVPLNRGVFMSHKTVPDVEKFSKGFEGLKPGAVGLSCNGHNEEQIAGKDKIRREAC